MWNLPDVEEVFERAFRDPFSLLEEIRPTVMTQERWFSPNFDIDETGDAYLLSVDLPGVKKDNVKIDLSENILTVSGERKQEYESKSGETRHYGRSYGRFQRSFALPGTVDVNGVEATLEDGVLHIALPKSERAKPRSIEIQTGKSGFLSKILGSGKKTEDTEPVH